MTIGAIFWDGSRSKECVQIYLKRYSNANDDIYKQIRRSIRQKIYLCCKVEKIVKEVPTAKLGQIDQSLALSVSIL